MTTRRIFSLLLTVMLAVSAAGQQERKPRKKKKNEDKEPVTQTLPVLKDPPGSVSAETARLTFHVSPLSAKGLLSQQTRDAIKALTQANRGGAIVKLRAFVAGTGDMRRVQTIVSEIFTDKKQPLPALTTIQVGALPMEGAQVAIESISVDKKSVNPNGLAFFAGQRAPDAATAVAKLEAAAREAKVGSGEMLRVSCWLSSLDGLPAARAVVARAFPAAAANFAQSLRLSADTFAVCEAVGRVGEAARGEVQFLGAPDALAAVLVRTPKVVLSGTQMAFRDQDSDLRLAFDRLSRALDPQAVTYKDVIFTNLYPLTRAVEQKALALRGELLPKAPGTVLLVEGLPSLDATMAVEVVAARN